jgi:hypothetical protein
MFRNKGLGHKWLKKKRVSLVEINISIVEKNVKITERFFDNHYNSQYHSASQPQ